MARKVLITGIGGLLGAELAKKYHENGCEIFGIQRSKPKPDQIKYKIFSGDINDEIFLEESFQGMDLVIHAAAKVSFDRRDKKELYLTNVKGTQKVINACLYLNTPKIIHVSSVAALGRNADRLVINEENQWENSKLNTNYAYSKYLAEQEFWRGIEEGLKGFCINPSIILGREMLEPVPVSFLKILKRK
ncbi:MAG: NAD-dependent epimerase/dehydratase family protein [Bacteroidia bacterium]|nr:NAD-dependent epimerase/dehydratase family protein [Bacteroidia bacterium]